MSRRISASRSVRDSSGLTSARFEVGFNSRIRRTVKAGLNRVSREHFVNRLGYGLQRNILQQITASAEANASQHGVVVVKGGQQNARRRGTLPLKVFEKV